MPTANPFDLKFLHQKPKSQANGQQVLHLRKGQQIGPKKQSEEDQECPEKTKQEEQTQPTASVAPATCPGAQRYLSMSDSAAKILETDG